MKDEKLSRRFWLYAPGQQARLWVADQQDGVMGFGMDEIGDLRELSKKQIAARLRKAYTEERTSMSGVAGYAWRFVNEMNVGDVVFVKEGMYRFRGVGIVMDGYHYDRHREEYRHVRGVKWIRKFNRSAPWNFGIIALTQLKDSKRIARLMAMARLTERELLHAKPIDKVLGPTVREARRRDAHSEFIKEIDVEDAIGMSRVRRGQARYKNALMRRWHCKCAVTGIGDKALLRASHIKPFHSCTRKERYDVDNGLLLAAHVDALFDRGLISFDSCGRVMISSLVSKTARRRLCLSSYVLKGLNDKQSDYLDWHRCHVYHE